MSVSFETLMLSILFWINLSVWHLTSEAVHCSIKNFHIDDRGDNNILKNL